MAGVWAAHRRLARHPRFQMTIEQFLARAGLFVQSGERVVFGDDDYPDLEFDGWGQFWAAYDVLAGREDESSKTHEYGFFRCAC